MNSNEPQKLKGISEISDKHNVYFVDLWGVVHNGVQCYPEALKVLEKLKEQNKKIVLISNAPRPSAVVKVFLETIGLESSCYDFLVTSGDITREYISLNSSKKNFYHLGPTKDIDLFKDLNVALTSKEECDEIICTGLVSDEEETLQDYKILLDFFLNKKIPLICANPDEVAARGEKIIFCAGALANQYKQEGGMVRYFGKPYSDIYSFALKKVRAHKDFKDKKEINTLVIGDNIKTDIKGANLFNLDSVLILNGIYKDFFRDGTVNFDQLRDSVNLKNVKINYFQEELAWH
jgi:HAD superfamily hydrolase (TIGR01459 family)